MREKTDYRQCYIKIQEWLEKKIEEEGEEGEEKTFRKCSAELNSLYCLDHN